MEAVKPRKKTRKKAKPAATETLENEEASKDEFKAAPENDKMQEEQGAKAAGNLDAVARPDEEDIGPSEDGSSKSDTLKKSTNERTCGENVVSEDSSTRIPSSNEELDTNIAASISKELDNKLTLQSNTNNIISDISNLTVNTQINDMIQTNTTDIDNLGATAQEGNVETKSSEERSRLEDITSESENKGQKNEMEQVPTVKNEVENTATDVNAVSNEQSHNDEAQATIAESHQVVTEGERQGIAQGERSLKHEAIYPKLSQPLTHDQVKESTDEDQLLEPFTEDELKMFYFNPLLEQLEGFTERFLVISNQDRHEFYELVNSYFKSRNALTLAIKEFKIVQSECDKKKEQLWIVKELTSTAQGKCQDRIQVEHTENYQQVLLNKVVHGEIENSLKVLEKALYETLCLQMYTCQLARMRIISYIHDLVNKSSTLCNVSSGIDVGGQSPPQITIEFQSEVQQLRDSISVLFMFVRQPLQDQEFADNLHHWTEHLVSVLLRVASLADLVFLVNHIMRCPPGFPSKVASFVQFPVPHYHDNSHVVGEQYFWDNPLVHHFVAMLAAILHPVRGREQFLEKMIYKKPGTMRSISWTLLDEDGEEDEDPVDSWVLFQESDLVDVFGQFPFDAFFKHLFRMDPYLKGEDICEGYYNVKRTTSRDIVRMLAFASCIVNIMGNAFQSYKNLRYRGFVKRIGRTIRQVVQYVLDHWCNYHSWRVNMCSDSYTHVPDMYSIEKQFSLQQLQTEVDQFFMRAAQQLISAHNLGAWQFLADMPFNSVSTPTLWNLFWALHTDLKKGLPQLAIARKKGKIKIDWKTRLQDHRSEFTDQLSHMSQSEAIFLLTTFTNMASSRESHEKDFIEAVTIEVFEVSFISDQTREFCSKTGRDLLGTIAGFHPFIFTLLLQRVSDSITAIGKACLYMFNGLPIHLCHPCSSDMDIVRGWLLKAELSSPEHQLARYILHNLNWGCVGEELGETDSLFLERSWHRAVAVMLVEASALRLPNRPGGISHDAFKEGGGLIQQVTLIAASSYSRLMQQNHEQICADWLWDMMLLLRLHDNDLPTPVMGFRSRSNAMPGTKDEGVTGFAGQTAALSSDEPLDLYTEKALVNVVNAIKANGPLACYVSIAMTMTGSNTDMFINHGLDQLSIMLNEKCFDAVLRIIYGCLPMFLSCPDKVVDDSRFPKILHRLCQLDGESAYYAEKLLLYPSAGEYSGRVAGIIQSHIEKSHFRGSPGPVSVIEFWIKTLCSLPNWYKDGSIQYLLDSLLKASIKTEGGLAAVMTQLIDAYKTVLKDSDNQGLLSSLWSLVSPSSTGPPQLWDIKPSPDYSYYAYYVLSTEDQMEENAGLRVQMAKVLIEHPDISVDYALRKVSKVMKLTWSPQPARLCIYRWANQTLATAMDHPVLPLIWQRFFRLYLERPPSQPGMPQRAGVGYRYFDSQADVSLLKKMKQRLQTTAEHHRGMTAQMSADKEAVQGEDPDQEINKQFEETKAFHEKLASYYQVLALWLDEPRLHDPTLYLPSLPPPYDPQRLEKALKFEQEPWWDLIHFKKIDWELRETVGKWMKHAYGTRRHKASSTTSISSNWGSSSFDTAAGRIIKRMKTHQPPRPPPPVVMVKSPLPPLTDKMLTNKQKIINIVHDSLQKLSTHAKHFCRETDHLIALDQDYLDLIPRMSTNQMTQLVKKVPCRSKFRSDHLCSGPATITLQFLCRYDNQVVSNRMGENRKEYDTMVEWFLQACPMEVCSAAAYVEMIITVLVKKAQITQERNIKEIIMDIGTSLFYQLAGCMSETVIRFQPTLQFFSSCIEILGKEFILNNGCQTEQLLSAILEHTSITMLLVPFFSPNDNPSRFTAMYHDVMQIPDRDLAFSLLTKFDLEKWLSSSSSSLIERSGLTVAVFTALRNLGLEVTEQDRAINEVYLRHMSLVLMFNFPEQYSDTLRLLFEGSSSRSLSLDVWEKFLFCIGCVLNQDSDKAPQSPTLATVLADEQVMETLDWLTTYFTNQRAELGGHVTGGLYTMWRPYIKQLSLLLGFMCQQVVGRTARQSNDTVEDLEKLWKLICKTFEPWICAQDNPVEGNPPVAPWNETEVPQASDMVALFTDTITCLHLYFPISQSSSSLMNLFWPFFVTSLVKPGIPDYVRRVHHSKFFSLPWNQFHPTPDNIDLMLKLFQTDHSTDNTLAVKGSATTTTHNLQSSCQTSFQFLGCVCPMMNWDRVVTTYCENQTPSTVSHVLTSVFQLFLMFTNDKTTMDTQGSEMPQLLERAHSYPWHHIDTSSFDEITTWQVEHCKAELILEQNSSIWHAIRLIRAAAGISTTAGGSLQPLSSDSLPKRICYVRCIASLLVNCSPNENLDPSLYSAVIEFVLRDIESIAGLGNDHDLTASEVCFLMSETLNLLNNCAPVNNVTTTILNYILDYIKTTTSLVFILASIPASCRTLANIGYMVAVLETGIEEVFARHSSQVDVAGRGSDWGWNQVIPGVSIPELAQDSFIEECIQQSANLTLYAYVLLRLSQCQSSFQEMTVMTDLVSWCARFKIRKENEYKITLFWHKILQLVLRQADFSGTPLNDVAKQLSFLAMNLHQLGEDKDSSGLLGAIGFGRKSTFTVNFRFMARVLEAFILAQLPSSALLRLQPKAPGYVREPSRTKQRNESGRVISSTNEAELALSSLENLRSNKQYHMVSGHITSMYSFIANPLHSLREGPILVARLAVELYPDHSALNIMN